MIADGPQNSSVKSSAHLRTMREVAGLSMRAAADLCGVSLRTWQYWESPGSDQSIKDDVYELLDGLLRRKSQMVQQFLDAVADLDARHSADEIPPVSIVRYRSQTELEEVYPDFPGGIGLHNAVVSSVLDALGERLVVQWAQEVS
ncbi:hypothetical protein BTO20_21075 [Mycobacterium dioxanotrophicus]|uniref:Uncharacterized protein n=1 Tax=Mycobacterium dioxanotrophicus TaxID=482462 RepID=A0A1Y0C637_9MYCO|nr:DUF1870 family protein [Mycobacterium dioxanotrophicus]ART70698.1 hypothetical protein BTO20_21075 [Mycobacterium dioxanotrophicus]